MTKTDPEETPLDGTIPRTCSDERPCAPCFFGEGACIGPAPETVAARKKKNPTVRQLLDAQMFTVTSHECELAHLNTRTEKHGEENAPAADLKLVVTGPHSLIECFGEGLREFLFREPGVGEDKQTAMDLGGDKRTKVRYPKVKPVTLDDEFPGYAVILSPSLGAGESLTFKGAKLKQFRFKAIDGGAVGVTFSAAVYPDEHQAGVLFGWQKKTLVLTLERPKAASEQQRTLQ